MTIILNWAEGKTRLSLHTVASVTLLPGHSAVLPPPDTTTQAPLKAQTHEERASTHAREAEGQLWRCFSRGKYDRYV